MDAELQWFREGLEGLSVQELKDMLVEEHAKRMQEHEERTREHEERMRENMRLLEFERSSTAMSREYQRIQDKLAAAEKELSKSRALCKKLQEENGSLTKQRYGRHSEKTDVLFESADDPNEDPLSEEHMPETEGRKAPPLNFEAAARKLAGQTGTRGSKQKGKRMDDLGRLEQVHRFDLDVDEMDKKFGKGKWTIVNWHSYTTVKHVRETVYAETVHEPVIKHLDTGDLVSMPRPFVLYPYSFASPSLVADILYKKYVLGLPLYRIERDYLLCDLTLSRQTMSNWVIHFAFGMFGPVYDRMIQELMEQPYHQSDETVYEVIRDGRKAGSKSFIWLHTTSECYDGHKIAVYCYEPTRGTGHLRRFYAGWEGTDTSDAYTSYLVMEQETCGRFLVTGCLMHCRRRYADAFSLLDLKGLTEEQIQELPEAAAIRLIRDIYHEENLIRGLPDKERLLMRRQNVRPKVDAFFRFADEFDTDDPGVSNKMKDAIMYTRNQKKYLCRFLEDGNIPLDNGNAERCMKPVAQGRRAYLFSTSIDGAKANTIVYTLVETARKNGADPYYYMKYILEKMPGHLDGKDRSFLSDMMPWSDAYRRYESAERNRPFRAKVPESQACPSRRQVTDNVS